MFAQLTDSFSDGDFANNPVWLGHFEKFIITEGQLQLQAAPLADVAYLNVESKAIDNAAWEFYCKLLFNPSSSNYARVYLVSDQPDLANALNGYYVMVGNTADEISLYKQSGTTRTKIIDGVDKRLDLTALEVKVKVTRDASGNWKLFSDVGNTGSYVEEGAVSDNTHIASAYAGVLCTYTSTRADKFYFDDFIFTGDAYVPPPPPAYKDIIITEIFADPTPRQELPEVEFVEIFNRSDQSFSMADWLLTDGTSQAVLPVEEIQPNEFIILCSTSAAAELQGYGKVLELTGFPSLNNIGDDVMLQYKDQSVIDSVHYTDNWYRSETKKEGGWSLEIIDVENTCGEEDNWAASEDTNGGTPGKINSVAASNPDVTGPTLVSVFAEDDRTLVITFNEKLEKEIPSIEAFKLEPAVLINAVSFSSSGLRALRITLNESLQPKTVYTLTVFQVFDCAGNQINEAFNQDVFALPETAVAGDLLINEILFNPRPNGVDFVELVNVSDKFIDVSALMLGNIENELIMNQQLISVAHLLLVPGEYLVLTENAEILKSDYNQTIMEVTQVMDNLPSMNDDSGSIALSLTNGTLLDALIYSKEFHSPFIQNDEGVSLERISFSQPTQDANNWKSASTQFNYATPGFLNSQARVSALVENGEVMVTPELFEPITGQPSFTEIKYQFATGGYMANVKIVDPQGRVIKELVNNELLGTSGSIRWDGDTDDGAKARIGYYMVWVEVFDDKGSVSTYRKRVGIVTRF